MFRWFLIACATLVSGCGFMSCDKFHQTAITAGGMNFQWWMLLTGFAFIYFATKVRG